MILEKRDNIEKYYRIRRIALHGDGHLSPIRDTNKFLENVTIFKNFQ